MTPTCLSWTPAIPHAIRHGAILGALSQLTPGTGLVLVAPHDPLPLLAQVEHHFGGQVTISYDQRGPDAWKLRMARS